LFLALGSFSLGAVTASQRFQVFLKEQAQHAGYISVAPADFWM
jgi:hypothetical protein